jgi:hypothetical protein
LNQRAITNQTIQQISSCYQSAAIGRQKQKKEKKDQSYKQESTKQHRSKDQSKIEEI